VKTGLGVVEQARTALGSVGALLPWSPMRWAPAAEQGQAVRRLERAGYGAVWLNEVLGKDAFAQAALLLAATERLVLGTAIANVWARSPQTARGAAAQLSEAFPGRFVLGLGVGYADQATSVGRRYGSPVSTMREYLDKMAAPAQTAPPEASFPRIIGANGPRMLALAGEHADGAMPAGGSPDATAAAREELGPDKLLVVLADAGTGDPPAVAARVRAYLAAGADHVVALLPIGTDLNSGVERLVQLAPALHERS